MRQKSTPMKIKPIENPKERMRKYREKIKQDPQKYEEIKKKGRDRWRKRYEENKIKRASSEMTEWERKALQEKWREKTRKYRAKMKQRAQLIEKLEDHPPPVSAEEAGASASDDGNVRPKFLIMKKESNNNNNKIVYCANFKDVSQSQECTKQPINSEKLIDSPKERMRKYREKIKQDPEKYEEIKKKARDSWKKRYEENKIKRANSKMIEQEKRALRKKWREKTRKYRAKIKQRAQLIEKLEDSPPPISAEETGASDDIPGSDAPAPVCI